MNKKPHPTSMEDDNTKLFDDLFEQKKNDPFEWGNIAVILRTAADVLFEAYNKATVENDEPMFQENACLNTPAAMLFGMALENAIKGYLIKKHGDYDKAKKSCDEAWQRHILSDLAIQTGETLSDDQKILLHSLQESIRWEGRFPIPLKRRDFTIPKQLDAADHITPFVSENSLKQILDPFYIQLKISIMG